MAIEEPNIKVPYSDPSINAQYSEFLKGEDLDPKFETEEPLFETIKDEPVTIGDADPLGLTAGSGLWTLSKKQKEERDKQLTKFTDIPESLAFDWETGQFGTETPDPLSISGIRASTQDTPLFSQDDPTGTVSTPSQAFQEAVDIEDIDRQSSWLGEHAPKAGKAVRSIWDVVPERSPRTAGAGLSPTGTPMYGSTYKPLASTASSAGASSVAVSAGAPITGSAGYGATVGAGGTAAAEEAAKSGSGWAGFKSGALKSAGQLLTIYSAKQAFDSGTSEGKFSGSFQLASLMNPALAPYVAAYEALKWLTGWKGVGQWFPGGGYKHPMGGVEFRLGTEAGISNDSDNSKFKYPGADDYDQLIADDSLRIVAPYSWGYNEYDHLTVKKAAQKQIGYLYGFADRYGLDINEDVFIKAARGTDGFEKYKPSGDRQVSVLERIDNIENGSTTANQWLREVMEYEGPNGQRIISGSPKSQNISTETGLYEGFTSQEEFQNDVAKYNIEYYG